jgi:hypothetical protein
MLLELINAFISNNATILSEYNEEGCQLDFLVTDLRLELLSDTVIQISITRSSEHRQISGRFQSQPV